MTSALKKNSLINSQNDEEKSQKKQKIQGSQELQLPKDPAQPLHAGKKITTYNAKLGLNGMQEEETSTNESIIEDENMDEEWIEVQKTRGREHSAMVNLEYIFGETIGQKLKELKELLIHEEIHCVYGPTLVKTPQGEKKFKLGVETKEELNALLNLTIEVQNEDNETTTTCKMFSENNNNTRALEKERTIEIYGLHPKIAEFRILSAMSKIGKVEKINTLPCRRGIKIMAKVVFQKKEDVDKFLAAGKKSIYIGQDLARVSWVGNEKLKWELGHIAKLVNLPFGTTTLDLEPLLGQNKAEFIIIPKTTGRNGMVVRNLREAFVYFSNEEDRRKNIETTVKIGGQDAYWADTEDKRCRECGKTGHIQKNCEVFIERMNTRAHIKAVKEYQKGGPLRVINRSTSYAQAATPVRTQKTVNQQQQQQQQGLAVPPKTEEKKSGINSATNSTLTNMEKKIGQLNDTIIRLQEEHRRVSQMNSMLMNMMIQMFSSSMGLTIPKEQLQALGLGTDISRIATKGKKNEALEAQFIPQANESLALLMQILNNHQSDNKRHQLPNKPSEQAHVTNSDHE
jgi:hypothetical protein